MVLQEKVLSIMDFTDELIRNTTASEFSSEGMIYSLVYASDLLSLTYKYKFAKH